MNIHDAIQSKKQELNELYAFWDEFWAVNGRGYERKDKDRIFSIPDVEQQYMDLLNESAALTVAAKRLSR